MALRRSSSGAIASTIDLLAPALFAALALACGPAPGEQPPAACSGDSECDDDNPCTDDVCTPAGECEWTANSAPCDDDNACTDSDACAGSVCVGGTNVCPCEVDGDCAEFEDGNLCNGTFVCGGDRTCVVDPGTVVTCSHDDDTECAKAACEPATGACEMRAEPAGTECSDGDDCTGGDGCQAGACLGAEELCCDDRTDNDGDDATDCDDTDCSPLAVCETSCLMIEPVEESPLPAESSAATLESTTVDGFSDDYASTPPTPSTRPTPGARCRSRSTTSTAGIKTVRGTRRATRPRRRRSVRSR